MSAQNTIEKKTAREVHPETTREEAAYTPAVDIVEKADEIVIFADMPGMSASDVNILFEKGILTIHGRVKPRQQIETRFLLHEYGIGDFRRSFEIGELIDAERISAQCTQGVLALHLPKVPAARPRRIEVKTG